MPEGGRIRWLSTKTALLLAEAVNSIRNIFSGRDLQVFTSGSEWLVTGSPITPTTVTLSRQTRIGILSDRNVPPVNVDGATLFLGRTGKELREFVYTDLEGAYVATDIALLSRHLFTALPIDQDFDALRRIIYITLDDGTIAALTTYRSEGVFAWAKYTTSGLFQSVSVVGDAAYFLVNRGGVWSIELFDDALNTDAAITDTHPTGASVWGGLDHLNGKTVTILADGAVAPDQVVTSNQITLDTPATSVQIGLGYTHVIEALPINAASLGGTGRALRVVEVTFRIKDTAALKVDVGRGLRDVALRRFITGAVMDAPPLPVTADIPVKAFGWLHDSLAFPWRIEQSTPLPFTLLSVTLEIKGND